MAQELQSQGRGEDSMLVHMTPGEVNSLQGLAMAHGGSLTINPNTGLPEAGWLGKLLPTILGAIATPLTGGIINPLTASALIGAGTGIAAGAAPNLSGNIVMGKVVPQAAGAASGTGGGFLSNFANAARAGLPAGTPGIIAKNAPMLAGLGVLGGVSSALAPSGTMASDGRIDNSYQGPYTAQQRPATFAPSTADILSSSKERNYFDVDQPEIYNMQGQVVQPGSATAPGTPITQSVLLPSQGKKSKNQPMYSFVQNPYMGGYAEGGEVSLKDGSFVVDARTVSELGNGSSGAGQDILSRMGGRAIRGPGDGVSDSIPARIGADQPARVARDEVVFSPEAVRRVGGGNEAKGAKKLYALMDKAHKARRHSSRGKDSKLRRGLA
jgi:hypothetical protein